MGYDAYVNCNCYKEGKTADFLYEEYLQIDEDGVYPVDGSNDEVYKEFYKWKKTACIHPDMEMADEHLANAWGMGEFKLLIEKLGGKDIFPILSQYLPVCNGGTLPAEHAHQALVEVERICNSDKTEMHLVLKDRNGHLISSTNDLSYIVVFAWTGRGRYTYGLYKNSFVIIEKRKTLFSRNEKEKIIFSSKHFIQYRLSDDKYKFVDIDCKHTFTCSMGLGEDKNVEGLECRVTEENLSIADNYQYILNPLRNLLQASIETGNPIIWC